MNPTVLGKKRLRFERATGGESSSGLGLHLTREFIAMHRGRIVAESPPDSGAIFTIFLPTVSA